MHFLLLSSLAFFIRNICNKEYTKHFAAKESNLFFNAISLSITCLISLAMGGAKRPSSLVLILAAIFAVLFVATVYLLLISYSKGPMGLVSLLFNFSMIIPITVGFLLFKEPISWLKGLGLLCGLFVLLLSWRDGEAKNSKSVYIPAKIWLPVTLLTMVCNGGLSTIQNMLVQWAPGADIMTFNFWAYLIGAGICWLMLLIFKLRGSKFDEIAAKPKAFLSTSTLCGLGSSAGNILNMFMLTLIPSTVAYPLKNSLLTVATYLVSILYYKEGRSKYGYLMVGIGIVSSVLLGIS